MMMIWIIRVALMGTNYQYKLGVQSNILLKETWLH